MAQAPNRFFNDRDRDRGRGREEDTGGFSERVVFTRRISKVVKGGRRLRFNALVVVGDGQGEVGVGLGKALVIPDAVRKGNAVARRDTVKIPLRGTCLGQHPLRPVRLPPRPTIETEIEAVAEKKTPEDSPSVSSSPAAYPRW